MGLLNDLSSPPDSIPFLLLSLIAKCVAHLRSLIPLSHSVVASPLLLHLALNTASSYPYSSAGEVRSICVFCYRKIRDGEQVRLLDCRHLFHKTCFDGWIQCFKFHCPICRSSLLTTPLTPRRYTRGFFLSSR